MESWELDGKNWISGGNRFGFAKKTNYTGRWIVKTAPFPNLPSAWIKPK